MLERLTQLPACWQGLWERTLLERHGPGTLTNDRPAHVYWLQTPQWHADLRIPLDRPDFSGVQSLDDCNDEQLRFLTRQEAFCGLTRVEGDICTWSRLYDLNPGTALDVARMQFESDFLIIETGIAENYLEHWTLVPNSRPAPEDVPIQEMDESTFMLRSGHWSVWVTLRAAPPDNMDLYADAHSRDRAQLIWQASLAMSLCEHTSVGWTVRLSTLPWLEDCVLTAPKGEAACA